VFLKLLFVGGLSVEKMS